MKRVFLSDNISVSRIAYGMWRLCDDKDNSPERVIKKLETCLESGIKTMDELLKLSKNTSIKTFLIGESLLKDLDNNSIFSVL